MIVKSLKLNDYQLFEASQITFELLNIVSGINRDNPSESGNGSGKTTISRNAVTFLLYGKVEGYNLSDLISLDSKKTTVEGIIEHQGKNYTIKRSIPTHIEIFINDIELDKAEMDGQEVLLNNDELKQKYLDSIFGDYKFFRQFRLLDDKAGIDLLQQTDNALRKTLMGFLEDEFAVIRQTILTERNRREQYSIDKRPYPFYLSKNRLQILTNAKETLSDEINQLKEEMKGQEQLINNLNASITLKERIVENNLADIKNLEIINKEIPKEPESLNIVEIENNIRSLKTSKTSVEKNIEILNEQYLKLNTEITSIKNNILHYKNDVSKIEKEIAAVESAKQNVRCSHCGGLITLENKEAHRAESIKKIAEIQKEIESSQRVLSSNTSYLTELSDKILLEKNKKNNNQNIIEKFEEQLKTANNLKNKLQEIENNKIEITKKVTENSLLKKQVSELASKEEEESATLQHSNYERSLKETHIKKLEILLVKFQEAFKFAEYQYTRKDLLLYDEAKKTLDLFASDYCKQWLSSLEIIINSLLEKVNMKINFATGKNFIEIEENNRTIKQCQLSGGQETFLSAVFKLAILIYQGLEGLIIADDGVGKMDVPNFKNFVEVCKTLSQLQFIMVYQNCPEIEGANRIVIERKDNKSEVL